MGIGFILFILLFLGLLVAVPTGLILAIKTHRQNEGQSISFRRSPVKALIAPVALVFCCFIAFIGYMVWCEAVLGEDPGIGDSWQVRLTNEYSFLMIDTTEVGAIVSPDRDQPVGGIKKIGQQGDFLFGESLNGKAYFLVDTSSNQVWRLGSENAFLDQCHAAGVNPGEMYPPETFYLRNKKWYLVPVPFLVAAAVLYGGFKIRARIKREEEAIA